jgi:hypothetical protein
VTRRWFNVELQTSDWTMMVGWWGNGLRTTVLIPQTVWFEVTLVAASQVWWPRAATCEWSEDLSVWKENVLMLAWMTDGDQADFFEEAREAPSLWLEVSL